MYFINLLALLMEQIHLISIIDPFEIKKQFFTKLNPLQSFIKRIDPSDSLVLDINNCSIISINELENNLGTAILVSNLDIIWTFFYVQKMMDNLITIYKEIFDWCIKHHPLQIKRNLKKK